MNITVPVVEHPKYATVKAEIVRVFEVMTISVDIAVGDPGELNPEINILKFAGFIATLNIDESQRQVGRLKERVVRFLVEPELAPVSGETSEEAPLKTPIRYKRVAKPFFQVFPAAPT